MATKKLQDLAESTSPNDTDIFIIEDTTATKKITLLNLFNKMISKLGLGSLATKNKVLQSDLDTALANLLAGKLTSSGIANNLSTTDATKVLAAPQGKELLGYIGTLSGLTTAQKTNLVVAVNELVERTDELNRNIENANTNHNNLQNDLNTATISSSSSTFFPTQYINKCDRVIEIKIMGLLAKALVANTEYLVTTLPDAYRPSANITNYVAISPLVSGKLTIGSDGTVKITPHAAIASSGAINVCECFIAKVQS